MSFIVTLIAGLALTAGPIGLVRAAPLCVVPPTTPDPGECFTSIQAAIDAAVAGDTITIAAGSYTENVIVDKQLTITGAGSSGLTITNLKTTGIGLTLAAGGVDATHRLTISDLKITHSSSAPGGTNGIYIAASVGYVTLQNVIIAEMAGVPVVPPPPGMKASPPAVDADGMLILATLDMAAGNGLLVDSGAVVEDLVLDQVTIQTSASNGILINSGASVTGLMLTDTLLNANKLAGMEVLGAVDGLTINSGSMNQNKYGFSVHATPAAENLFTNITVTDATFNANTDKGVYFEKLSNATFDGISIIGSGTNTNSDIFPTGFELNMKYGEYSNITLQNSVIQDSGTGDIADGVGLKIRDRALGDYMTDPATLDNVAILNDVVTGSPTGIRVGESTKAITPTNVTIHQTDLSNNILYGLDVWTGLVPDILLPSVPPLDAALNWWGGLHGPIIASNVGGDGVNLRGNVVYSPWLCSGTDTDLITLGFQPGPAPYCVGTPTKLIFSTQPVGALYGHPLATQPVVQAVDPVGNLAVNYTGTVALTLQGGTAGAVLGGTASVAVADGVAAFTNLTVDLPGTGYTLKAASDALITATSNAFATTDVVPTKLIFSTQPVGALYGHPLATQPVVKAVDADDNVAFGFSGAVTLALPEDSLSGTLYGTTTVTAVNGVATFTDLSVDLPGTGYTLIATSGALTNATSQPFNILDATPTKLIFSTQPGGGDYAHPLAPQPVVKAVDAENNVALGFAGNITLALQGGTVGATLTGTKTVAAVEGVATFTGLKVDKPGTNYTLYATSVGLTAATSTAFTITDVTATKLIFSTQPVGGMIGGPLGTQPVVKAVDAEGNVSLGYVGSVTLALQGGTSGAALVGTKTVAVVNGVATFTGLKVDKPGTGYTLVATSGTLTSATSDPFDILVELLYLPLVVK